jgi:hypothetical protein
MAFSATTTFSDGDTLTAAALEANLQKARDWFNGNGAPSHMAVGDIADGALKTRHLRKGEFEVRGRFVSWRGISGATFMVSNPASSLSNASPNWHRFAYVPNGCLANPIHPNNGSASYRHIPKCALNFELEAKADIIVRARISVMAPDDDEGGSSDTDLSYLHLMFDGTKKTSTTATFLEHHASHAVYDENHRYIQLVWATTAVAAGAHELHLAGSVESNFAFLGGSFISIEATYRRN